MHWLKTLDLITLNAIGNRDFYYIRAIKLTFFHFLVCLYITKVHNICAYFKISNTYQQNKMEIAINEPVVSNVHLSGILLPCFPFRYIDYYWALCGIVASSIDGII